MNMRLPSRAAIHCFRVSMLSLMWFKNDLRIRDNPALSLAAEQGKVLPIFIIEPEYWAKSDVSERHFAFLSESIESLQRDLSALGQPLILRVGDAVEVLARLHAKHRYEQIVSNLETGNNWTFLRDKRVADWARGKSLHWIEANQPWVVSELILRNDRGDPNVSLSLRPPPQIAALPPVAEASGTVPSARSLGLAEDRCAARQKGGRSAAEQTISSFLASRGRSYHVASVSPLTAERASSRLSPYLAFGLLSQREVTQRAIEARAAVRGQECWTKSLRGFQRQLALRQRRGQGHTNENPIEHVALDHEVDRIFPRQPDAARLAAWENGETGLPFVDASMRYLRATGWLPNRVRAMLQSVASFHLWLDWRVSGLHLARMSTDYIPAIHWHQVQIHSGVAGAGPLRIENPVKLGLVLDPGGAFIRRWLPELSIVPQRFVHEPWKWPEASNALAARYPEPIIDPMTAAKEARRAFALVKRKQVGPAAMVGQDAGIRQANSRASLRKATGQLTLDV